MSKILIVLLGALAAVTAGSTSYGVSRRISPFGIVEGIVDCGSAGRLGTVEIQDCTQVPCHFTPGNLYDLALRFVASVTSDDLYFAIMNAESEEVIIEIPITGIIEAGIEYELTYRIPAPAQQGEFTARIYILNRETLVSEICAQLDVTIG